MIYNLFIRGGPLMWPLLFCSLVSLTITIERCIFWWKEKRRNDHELVESLFHQAEQGEFDEALSAGQGTRDLIARVLVSGLAQRDFGLRESMEVEAQDQIERMKRGLNTLDTIITMAPLLGILGTVLGIIQSFDFLSIVGVQDPKAVLGGIAQALITTAAGLSVALLALVPFNYLTARVERAARDIEKLGSRFEFAYQKGLKKDEA
ncbi:MAG: MotA/TolQ/ExbB proton channel family protein [Deltaproteobacteria bacterium]|nr:MotA/TolQ/ExbB proton channel family protein [Deltaproteobacteria bacterium]MBW2051655.1 MotA/TolQ/ExbB proton channel family protein [Deltaproteobacteria bacterium]MBW2140228.1 MotA/TolQ/ExbB proton channel family protein [Deltaproteobacteria bacterium]MBW2323966.1 MotA/TolQ/ExbB proton channel family protein [Deltaproteobacteria bacterium]